MSNHTISIKIEDEKTKILELTACVPEHVGKEYLQQFGFRVDDLKAMRPVAMPIYRRVVCTFRERCLEDSEECKECENNQTKSYFIQK